MWIDDNLTEVVWRRKEDSAKQSERLWRWRVEPGMEEAFHHLWGWMVPSDPEAVEEPVEAMLPGASLFPKFPLT
jgi:hypothetical protein